jgi:hypothetical protein
VIPAPDETVNEQLEETLSQAPARPASPANSKTESAGKGPGKGTPKPEKQEIAEHAGG